MLTPEYRSYFSIYVKLKSRGKWDVGHSISLCIHKKKLAEESHFKIPIQDFAASDLLTCKAAVTVLCIHEFSLLHVGNVQVEMSKTCQVKP